ncbi:MAG: Rrf2 family transcriptional regulator, partial [Alphaproteobacteria bacterium]|nr:Rrf2 family transcriptional regulator [Alphaproteobacteria bacterium]
MRLTSFTDYGLRILMRLAGAPDRSFTTDQIATEFAISRNHLTKIVQNLSKAGYIRTQRGAGGGLRLSTPAQSITLGEIVRLLEQR